ncbi:protein cycle isoform X2 [Drosophila nasuta]|uniref:Protein cycle isoform X2 n=1 Tax=Drosophila albomicans TaxID=7291 RepID=A0A6P8Y5L1_DROAB|nr:protein cycle isoform X2 [Drosophila albomicans]XP_060652522.1 protein cycle isoform X2 [Drosophila nasuta]
MQEFCENLEELEDDTYDDEKSARTSDENRKQNHSEIEKRRRDKMNTYINELSSMIPMCYAMQRKLDKLTVLRMAVQHLRGIRGSLHPYNGGDYRPSFLSDQELKMIILQASEGFLFVVGCDRGRILYVSDSVSSVLNCTQSDLLGQSWFDVLHPKDIGKVKEQLSSLEQCPRERLIDAKTMLPVKTDVPQSLCRLCPGARRSFFCRMKLRATNNQIKEESDTSSSSRSSTKRKSKLSMDHKYQVIQCTGYLKSWTPIKDEDQDGDTDDQTTNLSCLVAIGRTPTNVLHSNMPSSLDNQPNIRHVLFISRHSSEGKFLFIDQRATLVIGFLPQEILGTSFYEYFHNEDISALVESHKMVMQVQEKVTTQVYRFRCKDNGYIQLQSEWRAFKNPWTNDIDYIIAKNSVFL